MNLNKKMLTLVLLIITMGLLNGCVFVNWVNQVHNANQATEENMKESVDYLQEKYNKTVEKITYDSSGSSDTFGVQSKSFFIARFVGDDFTFSISTNPNIEDHYLRDKWDYQMSKQYNDKLSEAVLKAFKAENPENSVIELPVGIEWNHGKEDFNDEFEIPNSLLTMSIPDLYGQGFIKNTELRQHIWIKESDLEYEKQKLLSHLPNMAKLLGSPDISVSAYYHIFTDKINVDLMNLQATQEFGVIGYWDEYKRYFINLTDSYLIKNDPSRDVWKNNTLHTDTFNSANDHDIATYLRELCQSKELTSAIESNKDFLSNTKFSEKDIEEAIQDQLNNKYQKGNTYEVMNYIVTEKSFRNSKLAYVRVKSKDVYDTEFIAIVDCGNYRFSPVICMDNYLERFIEKYLEEDFLELNRLNVSDYCVNGSFIMPDAKYKAAIENFRSGKYQDLIYAADEYSIKILLSKSKHTIDVQLLKTLQDKRDAMWESGMKNLEKGVFVFHIKTEFIDEGSYEMYGDKEYIKNNWLFFVDKRKLLQYGYLYDWKYTKYLTVGEDSSIQDGYSSFTKKHPLIFW